MGLLPLKAKGFAKYNALNVFNIQPATIIDVLTFLPKALFPFMSVDNVKSAEPDIMKMYALKIPLGTATQSLTSLGFLTELERTSMNSFFSSEAFFLRLLKLIPSILLICI